MVSELNLSFLHSGNVETVLKVLGYVPYVGSAIRSTRLHTIAGQAESAFDKGTSAIDKAEGAVNAAIEPIQRYTNVMIDARDCEILVCNLFRWLFICPQTNISPPISHYFQPRSSAWRCSICYTVRCII